MQTAIPDRPIRDTSMSISCQNVTREIVSNSFSSKGVNASAFSGLTSEQNVHVRSSCYLHDWLRSTVFLPLLQFDYSFRPASACTRAEFHYARVFFGAVQLPLSYSDDLRARVRRVMVAVPRIHYVLDRCL